MLIAHRVICNNRSNSCRSFHFSGGKQRLALPMWGGAVCAYICGGCPNVHMFVSVDAEVYDEMPDKTINIHYHAHTQAAGSWLFSTKQGDWFQVSVKGSEAKISEIAAV